jgi:hypothetical protein
VQLAFDCAARPGEITGIMRRHCSGVRSCRSSRVSTRRPSNPASTAAVSDSVVAARPTRRARAVSA